jgi:5-carboxymethyl-2-hydroxymuconate isomerase
LTGAHAPRYDPKAHAVAPWPVHAREREQDGEAAMPHLTLEVTDNLAFDGPTLLARLHDELAASGAVRLATIKSRVVRHAEWRVADGDPSYGFAHLTIALKEGRPLTVQQELADRALATLRTAFDEVLRRGGVSLSVDVRELRDAVGRTARSIPGAT